MKNRTLGLLCSGYSFFSGSTKGFAAFWKNQIVKFPENMQIIMKLRVIHAAEELHHVEIEKRQCKFEDEGSELKIFR